MNNQIFLVMPCQKSIIRRSETCSCLEDNSFFADPKNTVFVFDLHNVLLKRNYFKMVTIALSKLSYRIDMLFTFLNPLFIYDFFTLLKKSYVPEEFMATLGKKYPRLQTINQTLVAILNAQDPIPESYTMLNILKNKGFSLYLFSNIGNTTFQELKTERPELFKNFTGIMTVEEQDDWIQKPSQKSFEKFCNQFDKKPQQCILIDDRMDNIHAAQQYGFHTIHYRSSRQLCADIARLIEK